MTGELYDLFCFDTSASRSSSLALLANGEIKTWRLPAPRSDSLLVSINEHFQKVGLSISKLNIIGVSVGPGSFTGIRIGVSTALGLQSASNAACIGVSTLDALAFSEIVRERIAVVPLGRGMYAVGEFEPNVYLSSSAIKALTGEELRCMVTSQPTAFFLLASELTDESILVAEITEMPNVHVSDRSMAEHLIAAVRGGYGHTPPLPIYIRREG